MYRRYEALRWQLSPQATDVPVSASRRWIYDEASFTPQRLDDHRMVLRALRAAAGAAGVPLTVVIMPERGQVQRRLSDLPNNQLRSLLNDIGVPIVDLLPILRDHADRGEQMFNPVVEGHLSPAGHAVVAAALLSR